jgi:hypothetical protein
MLLLLMLLLLLLGLPLDVLFGCDDDDGRILLVSTGLLTGLVVRGGLVFRGGGAATAG